MDRELRPKITLHQVGAALIAVILGLFTIVVLGAALFGCSTIKPYLGKENQPQTHEQFVRWADDSHDLCEKLLFVDNPYSRTVVVHFDCKTMVNLDVRVPPHSTKVEGIYGDRKDATRDACYETGYDIVP
jgi:uncharacterized protein YceK